VWMMLDLFQELALPPLETLPVADARAFVVTMAADRPPGPEVGDVADGVLPGPAGPLTYRLYRPATPGPPPIRVYFPGGGRGVGVRRSCVGRLGWAGRGGEVGWRRRLRRLSARPRSAVPCSGRRRVRRGLLDRRPRLDAGRRTRSARGLRVERGREHRRRRLP